MTGPARDSETEGGPDDRQPPLHEAGAPEEGETNATDSDAFVDFGLVCLGDDDEDADFADDEDFGWDELEHPDS